jgi:hypothetical protein
MWLTPPRMNSQITLFAFGAKCGKAFSPRSIEDNAKLPKPNPERPRNNLRFMSIIYLTETKSL